MELVFNNSAVLLPNVFALEYDPHLVPQINLTATNARAHAAGFRTLTATPTQIVRVVQFSSLPQFSLQDPSVEEHVKLFEAGIDIVYSYDTENGVAARDLINKQRGVAPCE